MFKKKQQDDDIFHTTTTKKLKKAGGRRRGCFPAVVIMLAVLAIIIYGGVYFTSNLGGLFSSFGLSNTEMKQLFDEFNKPYDAEAILADKQNLKDTDYQNMRNKVNSALDPLMQGFGFFDNSGNLILSNFMPSNMPPNPKKNANVVSFNNTDIACLVNLLVNSGDFAELGYINLLSMLNLSGSAPVVRLTEAGNVLDLKVVIEIDFAELKKSVDSYEFLLNLLGINIPGKAYLTIQTKMRIDGINEYTVLESKAVFNQLNAESNLKVFDAFAKILGSKEIPTGKAFIQAIGQDNADLLKKLGEGWKANFSFSGNILTLSKLN